MNVVGEFGGGVESFPHRNSIDGDRLRSSAQAVRISGLAAVAAADAVLEALRPPPEPETHVHHHAAPRPVRPLSSDGIGVA